MELDPVELDPMAIDSVDYLDPVELGAYRSRYFWVGSLGVTVETAAIFEPFGVRPCGDLVEFNPVELDPVELDPVEFDPEESDPVS